MLIADVRRKEAYKPGDSKARRKRQTSYRWFFVKIYLYNNFYLIVDVKSFDWTPTPS
jgi:hypothetical protein